MDSLRFVTDLNKGILGRPDPVELWEEIIAKIPDEVFLKPTVKILCVAFGHGTEADVIARRMLRLGRTEAEVKNAIFMIDKYTPFVGQAKRKGYINVIKGDFLEWKTSMKFDVVVGNPPYQSTESETKKLWQEFIKKIINDGRFDRLAFVTPNAWFYEPDGRKIKQTTTALMTGSFEFADVSGRISRDYFPTVGEDIGYWIWSKNGQPGTVVHRHGVQDNFQLSLIRPVLTSNDALRARIQTKLEAKLEHTHSIRVEGLKGMQWQVGPESVGLQAKLSPIKTDVYSQAVRITPANTMYCEPHTVTKQWGVCFTNSGYYYKEGQQDKYMPYTDDPTAQNFLKITVESDDEAVAVYSYLKSKLYVAYVMKIIAKAFNDYALARLPFLGRDKHWTDQELYQHFGLTQEEIDYIEASVK